MRDARWNGALTALSGCLLCCGPLDADRVVEAEDDECSVRVQRHGGQPLVTAAIVNVYWGRYWGTPLPADNAFLEAGAIPRGVWDEAWEEVASAPGLWAPLAQYGVGPGSWGGSGTVAEDGEDPEPIPETRIQDTLERAIAAGTLPNRGDALYVVFLAPGHTAAADYVSFGGSLRSAHHGSYRGAGGARRVYAVAEAWNATMGSHTFAASHEIAEAATDPDFTAYRDAATGDEIADLCDQGSLLAPATSPLAEFFFRLHGVWSQRSCACVRPAAPDVL